MDRRQRSRRPRPGRRAAVQPGAVMIPDEYDDMLVRARQEQEHRQTEAQKRAGLWEQLLGIFRRRKPAEEELTEVCTLAAVAIEQVFGAYQTPEHEQDQEFARVKDYAECAALYGYVLGYHRAKQEQAA